MIFVGQLAVLERDGLAFRQEGDFNRIFANGIHRSGTLIFLFSHEILRFFRVRRVARR
jgi:hypothetical protein